MRTTFLALGVGAILAAGPTSAPSAAPKRAVSANKATPLILEKEEGERRVWRPLEGLDDKLSLFILKVDPRNGGSSHLVFGTEDMPPGGHIETHRHPGSDEILFLQNGKAKVSLGEITREVHGGATVFIPADTWITVRNTGSEVIHMVFVFSAPGFEDFMRAESVRDGETAAPITKAEDAAILAKHAHAVVYKEP
jgi:quercetin dioxygenase-like cupin family protein